LVHASASFDRRPVRVRNLDDTSGQGDGNVCRTRRGAALGPYRILHFRLRRESPCRADSCTAHRMPVRKSPSLSERQASRRWRAPSAAIVARDRSTDWCYGVLRSLTGLELPRGGRLILSSRGTGLWLSYRRTRSLVWSISLLAARVAADQASHRLVRLVSDFRLTDFAPTSCTNVPSSYHLESRP